MSKVILQFFFTMVAIISLGFMAISLQKTGNVTDSISDLKEVIDGKPIPYNSFVPSESEDNRGENELSSPLFSGDPMLDTSYDFSYLFDVNKDIIGWIVIPGTNIDYPILRPGNEKDNQYYLKRTYKNEKNSHGSIFIEKETEPDFEDDVSPIYGHNMKDGTMFAGLHKYLDMDFLKENNKVYIYTSDQTIKYEIFACMERDDSYITEDYPNVEKMLYYVSKEARNFDKTVDISEGRIVALSTCGASGRRILVFAVEQKRLDFSA